MSALPTVTRPIQPMTSTRQGETGTPNPTSRRVSTAHDDALRVVVELRRSLRLLSDLEVVGFTRQFQPADQVHVHGKPTSTFPPGQGTPKVRQTVKDATDVIHHLSTEAQRVRVMLESLLYAESPAAIKEGRTTSMHLDPGEIDALRRRRQQRVEKAGDLRFGEWEATPLDEAKRIET